MTRLIRLLPLAALVLTACTVTQKARAKALIHRSGVSTSRTSVI